MVNILIDILGDSDNEKPKEKKSVNLKQEVVDQPQVRKLVINIYGEIVEVI